MNGNEHLKRHNRNQRTRKTVAKAETHTFNCSSRAFSTHLALFVSFLKEMPSRCVICGCNNIKDHERGISIHRIAYFGDVRPEAKKRRKKWTHFVKQNERSGLLLAKFSVYLS